MHKKHKAFLWAVSGLVLLAPLSATSSHADSPAEPSLNTSTQGRDSQLQQQYSSQPQEKIVNHELAVVEREKERFERHVLRHLQNAEWIPVLPQDPAQELNRKFCGQLLSALRDGEAIIFPAPDVKSSEVGYEEFRRRWRNARQDHAACKAHENSYYKEYAADNSEKGSTSWLYADGDARISAKFHISSEDIKIVISTGCCNAIIYTKNKTSLDTYVTGKPETEYPAVTEIHGNKFLAIGGTILINDDENRFNKNNNYTPIANYVLEKHSMSDAGKKYIRIRILTLYPTTIPWRVYAQGTAELQSVQVPGSPYGPCHWVLR